MSGRVLSLAVLVLAACGLAALALRGGPVPAFGAGGSAGATAPGDPTPSPKPTTLVLQPTAAPPSTSPTAPSPELTFAEEFDGSGIPEGWTRSWGRIGQTEWSHAQSSVRDGILTITAQRTATGWKSDLLDTMGIFRQRYGHFAARINAPAGKGLWPTFWLAEGWRISQAEIDIMEICANPPGTHDGNDQTIMHSFLHSPAGTRVAVADIPIAGLTGTWHVFELDWRPNVLTVSVDGVEVWRVTDAAKIPSVPMAVIVDLAVGGWCGPTDATTPNPSHLQIDWIRVSK